MKNCSESSATLWLIVSGHELEAERLHFLSNEREWNASRGSGLVFGFQPNTAATMAAAFFGWMPPQTQLQAVARNETPRGTERTRGANERNTMSRNLFGWRPTAARRLERQ